MYGRMKKSHVWLFLTPWTVACQAPLSMGILQARILVWVAIRSSRDRAWRSCTAGGLFTDWATRESPVRALFSREPVSWSHWAISVIEQCTVCTAVDTLDTAVVSGEGTISSAQSCCHSIWNEVPVLQLGHTSYFYLVSKGWYTPKAWGLADPGGVASDPRGSLFLYFLSPPPKPVLENQG